MYFLNLTNPLVLLAAIMVYSLLTVLGKEYKNSALPAISLIIFLTTLGIYGVQMFLSNNADTNKILVTSKAKNKKSIDNSLDWFWKKV